MLKGKCLCGEITYTLNGELLFLYNCHCVQCRAFSGSSFATNASILKDDFEVFDPGNNLTFFEANMGKRAFCGKCGSPIYSFITGKEQFPSLHCGSISDYPEKKLDANLFTSEKCAWVQIDESVSNYEREVK